MDWLSEVKSEHKGALSRPGLVGQQTLLLVSKMENESVGYMRLIWSRWIKGYLLSEADRVAFGSILISPSRIIRDPSVATKLKSLFSRESLLLPLMYCIACTFGYNKVITLINFSKSIKPSPVVQSHQSSASFVVDDWLQVMLHGLELWRTLTWIILTQVHMMKVHESIYHRDFRQSFRKI